MPMESGLLFTGNDESDVNATRKGFSKHDIPEPAPLISDGT